MILELIPLALLGGVLGLDVVSFPQAMISRPIVAATLAGGLLGQAPSGMLIGAALELIALETLPFGASRYPEWGSASVVGGAIFATHSGTNHYCSVSSPQDFTYSFIDNNTVTAGGAYGIIDWDGIATTAKCTMGQNRVEASGNSAPACASLSCNPNCPQYPFSP